MLKKELLFILGAASATAGYVIHSEHEKHKPSAKRDLEDVGAVGRMAHFFNAIHHHRDMKEKEQEDKSAKSK